MYCTHLRGVGSTPPGCALVRSLGVCATEKEEQGGAANTALNCPARTQPSTLDATSGRARLWSCPPSAMSIVDTSNPRARSDSGSVDSAEPSPANGTRTLRAGGASSASSGPAGPAAGTRPAGPPPAPPATYPPPSAPAWAGPPLPPAVRDGAAGGTFRGGGWHVRAGTVARATCLPGRRLLRARGWGGDGRRVPSSPRGRPRPLAGGGCLLVVRLGRPPRGWRLRGGACSLRLCCVAPRAAARRAA
eukprot:2218291-Pleurochrysis_carterae.AAC.1